MLSVALNVILNFVFAKLEIVSIVVIGACLSTLIISLVVSPVLLEVLLFITWILIMAQAEFGDKEPSQSTLMVKVYVVCDELASAYALFTYKTPVVLMPNIVLVFHHMIV